MALMLVSHAILSWLLVPRLGAVGPAVSVVAAEGLLFAGCVFILLRKSVAGQMVPRHD
jgi:Na+-driven multidrug efflux pump